MPCLPVARVLALVGGLALVAAYFMPWFGTQGLILTGAFLSQLLGSTTDLRRLAPGMLGGPLEVQGLRVLVAFFPACGALAALLMVVGAPRAALRRPTDVVAGICGVLALVALVLGASRLPPGSTWEVGLWLIGLGGVAIIGGVVWDAFAAVPDAR